MRSRRRASALTALALSGAVVSGGALIASGRVGASAPEVICGLEDPASDRLRVNLSVVEDLIGGLRPPDGGGSRPSSTGCDGDERTGLDVEPPARVSVRAKNVDAQPVADVDTKEMRDDTNGLLNGTARVVNQVKDPLLQETNRALDGPRQQVAEDTRPLVDGANQVVGGTRQQVAEDTRPLVDGTRQVVGGTRQLVDDASRTVDETGRLFDVERWAELQR